jgi:hypothetical protein
MADGPLRAELERLVPESRDSLGWDDVLRRAGRIRRRRRRRTGLVATAALLLTLAGALGAAGQLAGLLSHTAEPHLLVRGELVRADGARAGTIEIELSRAAIVLDGHRRLEPWGKHVPSSPGGASFPARWFLDRGRSDEGGLDGVLYMRRPGRRMVVLCSDCGPRDSGRLDLSYAQASALVADRLVFALARGDTRLAAARLVLDRAHLHLGLRCRGASPPRRCTRFYTGR